MSPVIHGLTAQPRHVGRVFKKQVGFAPRNPKPQGEPGQCSDPPLVARGLDPQGQLSAPICEQAFSGLKPEAVTTLGVSSPLAVLSAGLLMVSEVPSGMQSPVCFCTPWAQGPSTAHPVQARGGFERGSSPRLLSVIPRLLGGASGVGGKWVLQGDSLLTVSGFSCVVAPASCGLVTRTRRGEVTCPKPSSHLWYKEPTAGPTGPSAPQASVSPLAQPQAGSCSLWSVFTCLNGDSLSTVVSSRPPGPKLTQARGVDGPGVLPRAPFLR